MGPRRNRPSIPLRRRNKEREWEATETLTGQSKNNEDRVPTLATAANFSRLTLCVNCEVDERKQVQAHKRRPVSMITLHS